MVKNIGRLAMFVMIIGLFLGGITKADNNIKTLFGMSCEVTRIPVSGTPTKTTFDSAQYVEELATLIKKGYNRIDMIKEFSYGDQTIKVLLGEKCDRPVLRINQEESVNDIGVDHIEKKDNKLLMYGAKDGYATLISCDLETLEGNTYKPFDLPKQQQYSEINSGNDIYTESISNSNKSTISLPITPLILEKKIIHSQDAFLLMQQPVSEIIKFFGGNWKRDRKELATILNIPNYRGTKSQNLQIRSYLLSYITIQIETIETTGLDLSAQEYKIAQQKVVSELVKMRGYNRKYDRRAIFQEIGGNIAVYRGTKSQNIMIRRFLLDKITPKKT